MNGMRIDGGPGIGGQSETIVATCENAHDHDRAGDIHRRLKVEAESAAVAAAVDLASLIHRIRAFSTASSKCPRSGESTSVLRLHPELGEGGWTIMVRPNRAMDAHLLLLAELAHASLEQSDMAKQLAIEIILKAARR